MNNFVRDVRYGIRSLLKTPSFTIFAVITLALGIGVNTAIFSVADAILFRSLPFGEPDRIVMVWENNPRLKLGVDNLPASPADFLDWREQNKSFQEMATFATFSFGLTGGEVPEKVDSVFCTAGFFNVLGMQAARGRTFAPGEDRSGNNHVVVISDNFWRRRFNADPNLLQKSITLNGEKYTVIGIMPAGFDFPQNSAFPTLGFTAHTELWTPLVFDEATMKDRRTYAYPVIARLKPGVTTVQAQADMSPIAANIDQQYKKSAGFGAAIVGLREQLIGDFRLALLVLLGTVAFVLLIACSNVANLMLAWFLRRQKEFAIRAALGATRAHLIRQMLTESLLLALAGGALGLLLARLGISVLLSISPDNIPRVNEVGLNGWVLGITFLISLVTGVLTGLMPAIQASRTDLNSVLTETSRGATFGARSRYIRNLLIISEVGLTLVLLIGAGLLIRSFRLLQQAPLGFNPDRILTMQMALPDYKYPEGYQRAEFHRQLLQRISSLQGVEAAAVATSIPLSGSDSSAFFEIEGRPAASPQSKPLANFILSSPDFFTLMKIPLMKGRAFTDRDTDKSPPVAIINEAMAKSFWPTEDRLGKRLSLSLEGSKTQREIVGVVGDVRSASLGAEPKPAIYVPYAQNSYELVYLGVRTKSAPLSLAPDIRREVLAVDNEQPVYDIKSMNQVIWDSSAKQNFNVFLLTIFAALALVLAMVGVYGVIASSISQRTHEIGIRMALGAQPGDILKLFLGQGAVLILIGLTAGLAVAFGLTRVMASLLYQIKATDPATFLIAILVLAAISLLAIYLPARRAAKLEPMIALREE